MSELTLNKELYQYFRNYLKLNIFPGMSAEDAFNKMQIPEHIPVSKVEAVQIIQYLQNNDLEIVHTILNTFN